uniref:Movement protein TGBp3 n=1 Tax=Stevia carlavirus 1 TaxID=2794421 RepID=A0A7T5QZ55_9VIRU|nr:TGB3 [Stevia carlavirus 1]
MHENSILFAGLIVIVGCIITLLQQSKQCVIVISGESVRVIGCEITEELVKFAKEVKPAGSC